MSRACQFSDQFDFQCFVLRPRVQHLPTVLWESKFSIVMLFTSKFAKRPAAASHFSGAVPSRTTKLWKNSVSCVSCYRYLSPTCTSLHIPFSLTCLLFWHLFFWATCCNFPCVGSLTPKLPSSFTISYPSAIVHAKIASYGGYLGSTM